MADSFGVCAALGASGGVDLSNAGEVVVERSWILFPRLRDSATYPLNGVSRTLWRPYVGHAIFSRLTPGTTIGEGICRCDGQLSSRDQYPFPIREGDSERPSGQRCHRKNAWFQPIERTGLRLIHRHEHVRKLHTLRSSCWCFLSLIKAIGCECDELAVSTVGWDGYNPLSILKLHKFVPWCRPPWATF